MLNQELRQLFSSITSSSGKFLGDLGITPNMLSCLVLIFGLFGAFFISQGNFWIAAIFMLASGLFDVLDGAVSRAMNKTSNFGYLLDAAFDKITELSWFIALPIYDGIYFMPCLLAACFTMLSSYISERALVKGGKTTAGFIDRKDRLILLFIGMFFQNFLGGIIYFIAVVSFLTALHRIYKNYSILK